MDLQKNNNKGAAAPNPAVVVSSLNKLDLSDDLKRQISQDYLPQTIDIVVGRCLRWKTRKSDAAAMRWLLDNFDDYEEPDNAESVTEKNLKHLEEFRKLDGTKIGHTQIAVGRTYVEFICGTNVKRVEIGSRDFKSDVEACLEFIKRKA